MTTHEERTMTESGGESPIAASEVPRVEEAARVEDENTALAPEPTAAAEPAAPSAAAPEVEPPSAKHESSAEEALFAGDDLAELRARWAGVQAAFVDDPKECVQKADALVSDLVEHLTTGFGQARSRLEEQWSRGEKASTEDLRLALMHYREFFERLLAV
jgi:hypothetical protein